jgi:hypothetical protein
VVSQVKQLNIIIPVKIGKGMKVSFFGNTRVVNLMLVIIFALALGIRLLDLTDLPKEFGMQRQMYSFIKARGMYYEMAQDVPDWKREIAVQQWQEQVPLEPPVFERIVAFTYLLFGEHMWIARIYSAIFWLAGGLALFMLTRRLTSTDGALVSLLYYLFLYFAILASRSFQPDVLMIALGLYALWAFEHWMESNSWKWAVVAGLLSGAAIFVKPPIMGFHLLGAFAVVLLSRMGLKDALRSRQVWSVAVLAALPTVIYLLIGLFVTKSLGSQTALRFFPELWTEGAFYIRWNNIIGNTAGAGAFILSLLAIFLADPRGFRPMLIGLWLGYLAYGFTLPHHITTHDYYQLPAIMIIALSLSAVGAVVFRKIAELYPHGLTARLALLVVILFAIGAEMWDVRVFLVRTNYRPQVKFWEELGDRLGHTTPVLGLTESNHLAYWGFQEIDEWYLAADINLREKAKPDFDNKAQFLNRAAGKKYFVVTLPDQFDGQPEIKELVTQTYPVYEQGPGYVIYDLEHPLKSP